MRFRWLAPNSGDEFYNDVSVPLNKFLTESQACHRVFIVENKMNFLTFPQISDSIAIWGKGFAIESLRDAFWLNDKEIFYWSDLDVQGFQMLSQLRGYFSQTKSFLMDGTFLVSLKEYIVAGKPASIHSLPYLNEIERGVFERLRAENIRLEQERIPQAIVIQEIFRLD